MSMASKSLEDSHRVHPLSSLMVCVVSVEVNPSISVLHCYLNSLDSVKKMGEERGINVELRCSGTRFYPECRTRETTIAHHHFESSRKSVERSWLVDDFI